VRWLRARRRRGWPAGGAVIIEPLQLAYGSNDLDLPLLDITIGTLPICS
jgi:hypothetical protein